MLTKKFQKVPFKFVCEKCDYYTNRKSQYDRHLQTKKHNTYKYLQNTYTKKFHICECGKTYKHRQSLNTHKKNCSQQVSCELSEQVIDENPTDIKSMFMSMLQTNKELQEIIIQQQEERKELQTQLLELAKEPKTIIQTQNNNNNSFNLNNFLNVQCKDAMNLSDFLDTIHYTFKDLLHLGEQGFVKSVQNTFVNNSEIWNKQNVQSNVIVTGKQINS